MHIGLVGGLDRSEAQYRKLAACSGHSLEWHTGDLAGRGTGTLEALVERSDIVIVVTAVNSHGAVWRARKLAKLRDKRLLLLARCGVSKFAQLLSELSSPGAAWKRVSG
jgi:phosphoglycerate dehydrogenase-like enzyme